MYGSGWLKQTLDPAVLLWSGTTWTVCATSSRVDEGLFELLCLLNVFLSCSILVRLQTFRAVNILITNHLFGQGLYFTERTFRLEFIVKINYCDVF